MVPLCNHACVCAKLQYQTACLYISCLSSFAYRPLHSELSEHCCLACLIPSNTQYKTHRERGSFEDSGGLLGFGVENAKLNFVGKGKLGDSRNYDSKRGLRTLSCELIFDLCVSSFANASCAIWLLWTFWMHYGVPKCVPECISLCVVL